ncbi:MAG: type pilus assembly protein PilC [Desulfuromonadales bacterium]|nr:type pilus assembly protein PilC [Desulfuromonadales bacterium]
MFVCKVGTPDGRVVVRYCRARNRYELLESLQEEGCCVFKVRRALFSLSYFTEHRKKRWTANRFLLFNQEMLVLLRSGMSILEIFDSLVQEKDFPATKTVLRDVRDAVKGGSSISEAFAAYPEYFPRLYVASVASGEKTGDLPQTLERYLIYQKRMLQVKDRLKSAAVYPLVLIGATVVVLLFMIFFVIPNFVQIYADAQVSLPALTRVVLACAGLVAHGWYLFVLGGFGLFLILRHFYHTPKGRGFFDKTKLEAPLLGNLYRLSSLVNFSRTTATILSSGLPLVEAMQLARGVINNIILQKRIENVINALNEGDSLGAALERNRIFPTVAQRMIATGEKTGTLPLMFEEVAAYYDADIDHRLERLASLAEPMILLIVGLVIGGIVIAIYLPIFQLAGTVR